MKIATLDDVHVQTDVDRLFLLIRKLGMKQYEFAKELGYSPMYVESVINGRSPFTKSFRKRINTYLMTRASGEYI
ncbi:helix-turn-helix domain-containing protein [Bacillus cihuensis]|uniref:helix-turn-helix domain-containing protein n=1 Tax=Bacillus cihuensis TaxID=1208599 RepID=UPI00040CFC71|nr:helix-turn-helix transcriptional regulator [Bacillus cihuensis]